MRTIDPYGLLLPQTRANLETEAMAIQGAAGRLGPLLDALQKFDPEIVDIKFFGDRAEEHHGIKRGRWHVHRRNKPPAPDTFIPIETPDGGYREPDFGVVDELRSRDLWKDGRLEDSLTKRKPAAFEKSTHEEALDDEIAEDLRAGLRVPGEAGMTKRLFGKK